MHICISYYFLTSINSWYNPDPDWYDPHPDPDPDCYDPHYDRCYYSPVNQFQYSLPLFIFLQMMVAMFVFVQFKWKWGARTVSLQQSFTVILF